ncbi:hypothetical protein GC175_03235 [bacterium]|nr:hypothetical protein [bacterium]
MMDLLNRILFVLLAAAAGFIPGGTVVMLFLRNRPRTGFDGVAETVFGAVGGVIVGLLIGIVLSGRLSRAQRWWGLLVLLVLIGLEVAVVMLTR